MKQLPIDPELMPMPMVNTSRTNERWDFATLEVGQSFWFKDWGHAYLVASAADKFGRPRGWKFERRTLEDGSMRVWRTR